MCSVRQRADHNFTRQKIDTSLMGRKIIDKQDGTLEDDIRYGDGDKMKWSENTIREEVKDWHRYEDGVEEGKGGALREERRTVRKDL